jgi:L-aspartate oxidase
VHGANRLASNSLLEGLVFGARAGRAVRDDGAGSRPEARGAAPVLARACRVPEIPETLRRLHDVTWNALGIERDEGAMREAGAALRALRDAMPEADLSAAEEARTARPGLEVANMVSVAALVARGALWRRESRGAHHRVDFPVRDDARFGRSGVMSGDGEPRQIAPPAAGSGREGVR